MIRRISKYRDSIMGIAILWIVLHHSGLNLPNPLFAIKRSGYGGVDMFLFVSGMGCAYSYLKDKNIIEFYKRRIKRIYPHFLPIMIVYIILHTNSVNPYEWFRNLVGNITGLSFWSGVGISFNWYISAIIFLYAITPILLEVLKSPKRGLVLLFVTFIAGFCFFNTGNMKTCISRIPIYILGLIAGMKLRENDAEQKVSIRNGVIVSGIGILGIGLLFALYRYQSVIPDKLYNVFYPFILITPAIMLWVCWLFDKASPNRAGIAAIRGLSFIGKISLDIYLFHVLLFPYIGEWLEGEYDVISPHPLSLRNIVIWLVATAFVIFISWGYNKFFNEIMKKKPTQSKPQLNL